MIEIITYQEKYKADFIRLNTEWIETWFWLEESDRKTFATVDSYIIGNGGQIFLALDTDSEETLRQADHCIGCGQCMVHCPQTIKIPDELHRIDQYIEKLKQENL